MEKKKRIRWTELRNLKTEEEKSEWIKNFCDKHGVESPTQLEKKYKIAYIHYSQLSNINKDILFPNRHKYSDWSELKNLKTEEERINWIKKFCDEQGITSPCQLEKKFSYVYKQYSTFTEKGKDILFPNRRKYNDWVELRNLGTEKEKVGWIIDFCNEYEITLPNQLKKGFPQIHIYYRELSEKGKDIIFPNRHKYNDWTELRNLKTEEERVEWIKNFCDEQGITSSSHLNKEFNQVFGYYRNLSKENREKILSPVISLGEETLGRLLTEGGYVFTTQKDFPDLRSDKGGVLRYDAYIERKNCLIEFHGEQHFNPNCRYYSKEGIERDKIKYQYAKDNGITIIYITDCVEVYEKYGYFAPVFTNWDDLMEYINSLPDVNVEVAA